MLKQILYPEITPYDDGHLKVSETHQIYYQQCGNPEGKPVVVVHGGPGGGCPDYYRQFFDPQKYRVILFDQRGCGKSLPLSSLEDNTTWHLVADMEKIREHLGVESWQVFGGSWGSTLGLAYSQTHPTRVTEIVLRGIFLVRKKEIDWYYQKGASEIFPDVWETYLAPIPEPERGDLLGAYYRRLIGGDVEVRKKCARAWSTWEASTSYLIPPENVEMTDDFADAFARIECHYFVNQGFIDEKRDLIKNVGKIRHIPTVIVQGRYDVVCPPTTAWELYRAWPEVDFRMMPQAGHSMKEPSIAQELIRVTDSFAGFR